MKRAICCFNLSSQKLCAQIRTSSFVRHKCLDLLIKCFLANLMPLTAAFKYVTKNVEETINKEKKIWNEHHELISFFLNYIRRWSNSIFTFISWTDCLSEKSVHDFDVCSSRCCPHRSNVITHCAEFDPNVLPLLPWMFHWVSNYTDINHMFFFSKSMN